MNGINMKMIVTLHVGPGIWGKITFFADVKINSGVHSDDEERKG